MSEKIPTHHMNQPLPPVQATITITFHGDQIVNANFPTNMALTMFMIGQALASIGERCEFKELSPIALPPKGLRLQ